MYESFQAAEDKVEGVRFSFTALKQRRSAGESYPTDMGALDTYMSDLLALLSSPAVQEEIQQRGTKEGTLWVRVAKLQEEIREYQAEISQ